MTEQTIANESLFIVKDDNEYCFLYSEHAPHELYNTLLDNADYKSSGLKTDEVLEIIEKLVVRTLKRL